MALELPYDLETSATASAAEVMANLEAIATYADLVSGDRIDLENPLDKNALSDRFVGPIPIAFDVTDASLPGAMTAQYRRRICLPLNTRATIHKVEYYCMGRMVSGSDYPKLQVFKGSRQIGDTADPVVTGAWTVLGALANPGSEAIAEIGDLEEIILYLGGQNSTAGTQVEGLSVVVHVKFEHCA